LQTMEKIITPAEKEYLFFKDCWAECTVPCTHEVEEPTELMLEMPDGVRLRTVCYRPKTEQKKIPVVFQRCCYPNKEKTLRMHAEEFCKRGIAVVFQFCRGKGGSEGVWVPQTMNERTDGMALIQYLESLDWVGPMGYWGSSYMALCGLVLLEGLSDSVKTMYLTHYGTDRYMSVYESGLFRQDLYTGWSRENMGVPTQVGHLESCVYRPQVSLDTDLWGTRLDWYREWVTSTQPGDRCWNSGLWNYLRRAPSVTKIPIYYGASWFDIHCGGAMHAYENLAEESKEQSTFRIGAWEHGFYPCMRGHKQEHLENNNAVQALNWFMDILLEGKPAKKKVELYMIGADEWSSYDTYPLPEDKQMVLYLSDKASSPEAGTLSEDCEAVVAEKTYLYDPQNYVPSCGGESLFSSRDQRGSVLQPPCGYRPDVISFRTEVIDRDITIVGKIKGKLMVKSTAEDTAFTVKIMEEFPDGSAYNIRTGIATLAFRNGMEKRETYTPGTYVELEVPTWDVAWKPSLGSRIRVDIASSDFPQYAIHSNYPGVWAEHAETRIAEQTLLLGGENASKIIFPLLSTSN